MLDILATFVFAAHLLFVDIAAAGPLVCIWLHVRANRYGDSLAGQVGRELAVACVILIVLGMLLGFVSMALHWPAGDRHYFQTLNQFPAAKYWFALAELGFYFACMAAYIALWNRWAKRPVLHGLLAVLAATDLLYHFPPLLTIISVVASRPELADTVIDSSTYRSLMLDPEVASRVTHTWLASVAIAGVAVMVMAHRVARRDHDSPTAEPLVVGGARIALLPTLCQLGAGVWVLVQLPAADREAVLGNDGLATCLLLAALVGAFGLMHQLAAVAFGDTRRKAVLGSVCLIVLVVLLMAATLRRTRHNRRMLSASHVSRIRHNHRLATNQLPRRRDIESRFLSD